MIDGRPSQTALMVAAMRAYHFETAPAPKILEDSLAMALSGFETQAALNAHFDGMIAQFAAMSDQDTAQRFIQQVSHSVCMRSRLVEGQIEQALGRGLKQLVILGAGLDSTVYRLGDKLKDLTLFEVDHPSTQGWKCSQLESLNIPIPYNLTFVPFDFEQQTLTQALQSGGVNMEAMTLFPWLGVQPYLTREAVFATLQTTAQFPRGSEIVMDFVAPEYDIAEDADDEGLANLTKIVTSMGEPFLSTYTATDLGDTLRRAGYSSVTIHKAQDLVSRFLGGKREAYALNDEVEVLVSAAI